MLLFWPHPTSKIHVSHPLPPYKFTLKLSRWKGQEPGKSLTGVSAQSLRLQWICCLGLASYEGYMGSFVHASWEKRFMLLSKIFKKRLKNPCYSHRPLGLRLKNLIYKVAKREAKLTASWGRGQCKCFQGQKAVCNCFRSLRPTTALSHLVFPVLHKPPLDLKAYLQKCTPKLELQCGESAKQNSYPSIHH